MEARIGHGLGTRLVYESHASGWSRILARRGRNTLPPGIHYEVGVLWVRSSVLRGAALASAVDRYSEAQSCFCDAVNTGVLIFRGDFPAMLNIQPLGPRTTRNP